MFSIPFRCERSTVIQKHISEISCLLSDFTQWPRWSPWLRMEP